MIWHDIEQNTDDWMAMRSSIPTASNFATVMASGKGGGESVTRRKYMLKLVAARIGGKLADAWGNAHTARGHEMEPEAIDTYAFVRDVDVSPGGFFTLDDGSAGCSPDGLVGNDGVTQVKTALPELHLEMLLADRLPPAHKPQVQGELWVAEREWSDFVCYWPGLPIFIHRVFRDEEYIRSIASAVRAFNEELEELKHTILSRSM